MLTACASTVESLKKNAGLSQKDQEIIKALDEKPKPKGDSSLAYKIVFYPVNRALDLLDVFRLNVGVGPGFGLNVRATKFAQVGVENYFSFRAGLGKRGGYLSPRYGLMYTEAEVLTMGVGPLYTGGFQRGWGEVGASAHLGIIGAEGAIDLFEFADFLAGFLLIDIKGDDF
jgi:hypothetical protein